MSSTITTEPVDQIDRLPVRAALLSVSDKTGLSALAKALVRGGVELFSTGGTEKFLREMGIPVRSVSDLTNFPEILDGRVKTLHPGVHGGLLFRRELESHRLEAERQGISPIDLLVLNLYPFEQTLAKSDSSPEEIIEQIDIGGPAMLRSAAKNFMGVALLSDPSQYDGFAKEFEGNGGTTRLDLRRSLAAQAFARVADYDAAISGYFESLNDQPGALSETLRLNAKKALPLRYGENPHQRAALYGEGFSSIFEQLWGKELSYNNIQDISAASLLMAEFFDHDRAISAIIKHTTPCGIAEGADVLDAFDRAFRADSESPYGGIVILNESCSVSLAERLNGFFSEVILAPEYDPSALEILKKKKDRRLVRYDPAEVRKATRGMRDLRSVLGGYLVQDSDVDSPGAQERKVVTKHPLTEDQRRLLEFAWKCVKHVKSNAIVYVGSEGGNARTLGIGGGQTSRVESSRIAAQRAKHFGHSLTGSVVASDAFFPFADGLTEAIEAGAVAVIQPGGSVRDSEVIQEADAHNIAMVLTGVRHFRH